MKILFVLSQIEVTGAETYALSLASALRELGHEIVLISDTLRDTNQFKFYPIPVHKNNTSTLGRIQNVLSLKRIIEEEKIELIHSHSRASNLVSQFSRVFHSTKKLPMIVTVHGRWRNHFAARWLPCLGDHTIAVCPYLQKYLKEEIGLTEKFISMVPNGIDTQKFSGPAGTSSAQPRLLFLGRFSGQKGKVVRFLLKDIFPAVIKEIPQLSITIAGKSPTEEDQKHANQINLKSNREIIKILDREINPVELFHSSSIVVGSGRVALEAMSCGKPVVAIGESSAPGLVTPDNFEIAFDSNFGDCGEWNLFEKENRLVTDLVGALQNRELSQSLSHWGRKMIEEKFDCKKVAMQIQDIYASLLRSKNI